jgi:phospholipid transport system substrate-binding protein
MKKILIILLILLFTSSIAFSALSPKEQIKKTVDNIISILKDPKYKGEKKFPSKKNCIEK